MATTFIVIGPSGTGKTSSLGKIPELEIEGLDPKETAIINVMDKPLPFRGSRTQYGQKISEGGNYASVSDGKVMLKVLQAINERQDIKNVIIDDFQYIMAEEFMAKADKKGYDKFTEIAKHAYDVISYGKNMRPDINFICLTHSELEDKTGEYKLKTIGKLLDEKINLLGLFTVALYSYTRYNSKEEKNEYYFVTHRMADENGNILPAKSPVGMFDDNLIKNDLGFVVRKANEYYD